MLDAPAGRRGRFGVGVLYGSLAHVIGVDLDVLIVLGMAEGSFPPMGVRSSVLSDAERAAIASPFAQSARACDERRSYLAAVASAGKRWLVTPRVGPDRVAYPAPWWSDAPHEHEVTIDSFDSELAKPSGPASSVHERDLRVLRKCPRAVLSDDPLIASRPRLAHGVAALVARGGDEFSEWNGDVGAHPQLEVDGKLLSATSLETWATCPARYFFRNVLGVREQDDIAEVEELERTIAARSCTRSSKSSARSISQTRGPQSSSGSSTNGPRGRSPPSGRRRGHRRGPRRVRGLRRAPYPILWTVERKQILHDVMGTLDKDPEGVILLAVEHHFGDAEEGRGAPFSLTLAISREGLRFRGSIDRVNELHTGFGSLTTRPVADGAREERPRGHRDRNAAAAPALWFRCEGAVRSGCIGLCGLLVHRPRAAGEASSSRSTPTSTTNSCDPRHDHEWHRRRCLPRAPW